MTPVLPAVIVCVGTAPGLDACLAALDRTLPAGTQVLVADNAVGDPRVPVLAQRWSERTPLSVRYRRRERSLGRAGDRRELLAQADGADVVLLDGDAVPAPGWLQQLASAASAHPETATLSTWTNGACLTSFPRFCEDNALPASLDPVAAATTGLGLLELPDLPMAQGPCLYLRGEALRRLGGWDSDSFQALGADADFCHRAAAMGWRNALCPGAFVGRSESAPSEPGGEDLRQLLVRWPEHQEGLARFLLADPLRSWRERILERIVGIAEENRRGGPQGDLFA